MVVIAFVALGMVAVADAARRFPTYYETLNVSKAATQSEIRKAFFDAARIHHPDRRQNKRALARMTRINEAYTTLKNVNSRAAYDLYLRLHGGVHHPNWAKNGSWSQWQTLTSYLYIDDFTWHWQFLIVLLLLGLLSIVMGAFLTVFGPIFRMISSSMFWIMIAMSMFNQFSSFFSSATAGKK